MNLLTFYQITYALTALTSISLGTFVYSKNRKSTINRTWLLTCIAVASWSAFMGLCTTIPINYKLSLIFSRIANISAMFIPIFFCHFCLAFVKRKTLSNKILLFGYIFIFFILLSSFSRLFIPRVEVWGGFLNYPRPGPTYVLFTISFIYYVIYSEYVLYKSLKSSPPVLKNQIKYIFFSTSIGFILGSSTFFGVYNINVSPLPANFTFVYTLIISYAIVKHNLWDINLVIRKGLIYSISVAILTALYLLLVFTLEQTFRGFTGYRSPFVSIFILILFVFIFHPLKTQIQKIIDKYFFHGTIDQIDEENIKLREELRKSEKLKAVATLAAGMAHEIKNPLTSIKTFTEYIPEKKNDPAFLDKFYKIVRGEVDRINYIVQELLEFSKPSELNLKKTDINDLLNETMELLNNDLIRKDIKIQKTLSSLSKISVDPSQIKQVFLNILLNAIDSMKNGGILTIDTKNKQDKVSITVKDTGAGISKEDLKHIFDPFFSKKDGGTGLGLSVVHGIIEKHNGNIFVKSSLDKGAEFEIILPI